MFIHAVKIRDYIPGRWLLVAQFVPEVEISLQEPRRHFRSPHGQRLITRRRIPYRGLVIDQIPVRIMLDHISCSIPPVVENLTSKNVSANTPDRLIVFLREPLVTQLLGIEVVNLE